MDTDNQQKTGILAIMTGATMILAAVFTMAVLPVGIAFVKLTLDAIVILGIALALVGVGLYMTSFSHMEQKASS